MAIQRKLVRDRIPEILAARGVAVETRLLAGDELAAALRAKLEEEISEYDAAASDDEALAELADVLEVVYAIAMLRGRSPAALEAARAAKARERGAFSRGVELVATVSSP